MKETYTRLKGLIGQTTVGRSNLIDEEMRKLGIQPKVYELDSPHGTDRHLMVQLDQGQAFDVWLTANYDTFEELPSGNNNATGVVALIGIVEHIRNEKLPVNVRLMYFDAGLDTDLITKRRRNPDFVPGSERFLQHLIDTEIDFIDTYRGAIIVQAVGKGSLCVFERTGRKTENSAELNRLLMAHGKSTGITVDLNAQSPNADNLSFLKEGLEATVLARYHEGSWHKMQTKDDDLANVNLQAVDETIGFLSKLLESFKTEVK